MTVYLDCNATTPIEPNVRELMVRLFNENIGNAGSRTHEFGVQTKRIVQRAREQVAGAVSADAEEVIFTSGATESNNIAIIGLEHFGQETGRRHIVSTCIEHKAVMEPINALALRGFEVTWVPPDATGSVSAADVLAKIRSDTLLVSVMHVNNETGVVQPISDIVKGLQDTGVYFHVDAAQGFGKLIDDLRAPGIDLISISSHKIYGPTGTGALVARRRGFKKPPLRPLIYGGGQELGLRPGTLPAQLIAGFGLAAELAVQTHEKRSIICLKVRQEALSALVPLGLSIHGDINRVLPHVLNVSFEGLDSEAVMLALKGVVAVSNGSACTSTRYEPSHVLYAMGLSESEIKGALRLSWSHLTPAVDWTAVKDAISCLM